MKTNIEPVDAMGWIVGAALVLIAAIALACVIDVSIGKSEIADCLKWSQEADAYPGFYLTHSEKDQCDAHSIVISAPVK